MGRRGGGVRAEMMGRREGGRKGGEKSLVAKCPGGSGGNVGWVVT
jgi:hypothetical protein